MNEKKPNWFVRHKALTGLLVLVVLFALLGAAGGSSNNANNKSTGSNTQASTPATPVKEEKKGFDYKAFFDQVQTGMTKDEVTKLAGQDPSNCTESQDPTFGTMEICSYGNAFIDKGDVMVTFEQGKVSNKTKNSY